jgi:hypothetical protein
MIRANQIESLLAQRHSADFFVSQCKNGPTQSGSGLLIMDAWVMKKSWANPLSIGYEIKVSRNDFLQDTKWHRYLDYCNEFYFAAPIGIIDPRELPPEVGLVVTSTNAKMILTKKKAARRQVDIPESLYRYVLMNKLNDSDDAFRRNNNVRFWEQWLKHKELSSDLGYRVSKAICEHTVDQKRRNDKLQEEIGELLEVKAFCERNNIRYKYYNWKQDIQAKINGLDKDLLYDLQDLQMRIKKVYDQICPPEKIVNEE